MKEEQKYNGSKTRNYFTAYLLAYWNAYRKHIKWKEIWYGPGKIFMRL